MITFEKFFEAQISPPTDEIEGQESKLDLGSVPSDTRNDLAQIGLEIVSSILQNPERAQSIKNSIESIIGKLSVDVSKLAVKLQNGNVNNPMQDPMQDPQQNGAEVNGLPGLA